MGRPDLISIVKELKYNGVLIRKLQEYNSQDQVLNFIYNVKDLASIDLTQTSFYGKDILLGIAFVLIREIRRIGGEFQEFCLSEHLTKNKLNQVMNQLFRIEGKIPSSLSLENHPYELVKTITNNIDLIESKENFDFSEKKFLNLLKIISQRMLMSLDKLLSFYFALNTNGPRFWGSFRDGVAWSMVAILYGLWVS